MINHLPAARRVAKRTFDRLADDPEYKYSHDSHRVAAALEAAETFLRKRGEHGTFGVEGILEDGIDVQYLNFGDTYETTILFHRGRFLIGCWGDITERARV